MPRLEGVHEAQDGAEQREAVMSKKALKLSIELVPGPTWGKSLRTAVRGSVWGQLRKKVYADQNHACYTCGSEAKRLNCHEVWKYDDLKHVQLLTGFRAICGLCHLVTHFAFAQVRANEGYFDIEEVIQHFNEGQRRITQSVQQSL